jgi:hypothetical protein
MKDDDSSAALLGKYMFGWVRRDININSWKNFIFVKKTGVKTGTGICKRDLRVKKFIRNQITILKFLKICEPLKATILYNQAS